MPFAAVKGDKVLQDVPVHCHNPGHPVGTATAPIPHPAKPLGLEINMGTSTDVKIGGKEAATVTSQTEQCSLATCLPGGPGVIAKGSGTVLINGKPAARVGDVTQHAACAAPIPSPTGKILPPGVPTVIIGG